MANLASIARGISTAPGAVAGAIGGGALGLGRGIVNTLITKPISEELHRSGLGGIYQPNVGISGGRGDGIMASNQLLENGINNMSRGIDLMNNSISSLVGFISKINDTMTEGLFVSKDTLKENKTTNRTLKSILQVQQDSLEALLNLTGKGKGNEEKKEGGGFLAPIIALLAGLLPLFTKFKDLLFDIGSFGKILKDILGAGGLARLAPYLLSLGTVLANPVVLGIGAALLAIAGAIYLAKLGYDKLNSKEFYEGMSDEDKGAVGDVMKFMTCGDVKDMPPEMREQYNAVQRRLAPSPFDIPKSDQQISKDLQKEYNKETGYNSGAMQPVETPTFNGQSEPKKVTTEENYTPQEIYVSPEEEVKDLIINKPAYNPKNPRENNSQSIHTLTTEEAKQVLQRSRELGNTDQVTESQLQSIADEMYGPSNLGPLGNVIEELSQKSKSQDNLDNINRDRSSAAPPTIIPIPIPSGSNQQTSAARPEQPGRSASPGSATIALNNFELEGRRTGILPGPFIG